MLWRKTGLVNLPDNDGFSYAVLPTILYVDDDIFIIAFTRRNLANKSHIFLVRACIADGTIKILGTPKLALSPGAPGSFDCDGVLTASIVTDQGHDYLYYGSWQNINQRTWISETGRAVLDRNSLSLKKEFGGPIMGRRIDEPYWATAPWIIKEEDVWRSWYVSLDRWEELGDKYKHFYCIKHKFSKDGIDWSSPSTISIGYANEYEYSIACASVLRQSTGIYRMWYSFREQPGIPTYRIGYAESIDGLAWTRLDSQAGIDVSPTGWDSEMICYPRVFTHKGTTYMLYNGNGYGKTGFGLAVLEED